MNVLWIVIGRYANRLTVAGKLSPRVERPFTLRVFEMSSSHGLEVDSDDK